MQIPKIGPPERLAIRQPIASTNRVYGAAFAGLLTIVVAGVVTTLRMSALTHADHEALWRGYDEGFQIERCKSEISDARYLDLAWGEVKGIDRPGLYFQTLRNLGHDLDTLAQTFAANSNSRIAVDSMKVAFRGLIADSSWTQSTLDSIDRSLDQLGRATTARQAELQSNWLTHRTRTDVATTILGVTLVASILGLGIATRRHLQARKKEFEVANELQLRMKWLAMHFPVPAVYVEGELVILNRRSQELTGYSRREVTTLNDWFKLLHGENAAEARQRYEANKSNGYRNTPAFTIFKKDGTPLQVELVGHRGRGGEVWVLRDVTELFASRERLQDANRMLQELAAIDGLTGVMNRRVFFVQLAEECEMAHLLSRELSVLLFDVDHFKAYNDAHGHPAGDEVLRTIGKLAAEAARNYDSVARYGGEEFALILPGTGRAEAVQVAENIRQKIESHDWTLRKVTVSIGVATSQAMPVEPDQLVFEADQALYAAKASGRNVVIHARTLRRAQEWLKSG